MTPFWIVNFMEKGSVEPFFETYWKAYLQNNRAASEDDKFFYITDATDPALTKEKLQEIASQRLSRASDNTPKLIPAFKKNNGNEINVIFVGDATSDRTIRNFHTWAAYLMEQKMPGRGTAWYSISKVSFYGILIRPDSSAVDNSIVTSQMKGFLNELQTMEQLDVNYRPFQHILFLQASENKDRRAAAEESLCIAAYHIARTNGACFGQSSSYRFHDVNATGVFYEADVQKELDAYNLGQLMLNDFIANEGSEFLDSKEAQRFVDDNSDFVDLMTPKGISQNITNGCAAPDDVRIKRPIHPLNILRIGKVWREYYGNYVAGMKRNLVNKMRRNLVSFESDFKKNLAQRQIEFIKQNTEELQKLVFQMFCDTTDSERFRHISLPQSLKVLEIFEDRIRNAFADNTGKAKAFLIPADLQNAADKAQMNSWTSSHVLDVLTDRLQRLPLYNLARLIRVLLLCVMAGGFLSVFHPLCWIIAPLILAVDLVVFNAKIRRIEALKDQYIGMKLIEMRNLLDKQVDLMIEKTKDEMSQYIIWLRENKLQWLQKSLSVIAAPSFQFNVSEVFQPLVSSSSTKSDEPKLLIPSRSIKASSLADQVGKSGSFGKHPLTLNVPTAQITDRSGATCTIFDLINSRKDTVQFLIQQLMREHQNVVDGSEEKVDFAIHETTNRFMLLLLDVSGSMFGQPLDELRDYVSLLSSQGSLEWIAFSDDVCFTSRTNNADDLQAVCGTNFIPAIEKAVEWISAGAHYDDIILISDGHPSEQTNDIIDAAKKLNQPLNTISIGDTAESVLVDIAYHTGGEEITVDSFGELPENWNNEILPRIAAIDDGNYSFGNLLKLCQTLPAARALRLFALKQLAASNLTLPMLIGRYGNDEGLKEWFFVSSQRNTINQGISQHQESNSCATADAKEIEQMKRKLETLAAKSSLASGQWSLSAVSDEPDMIASLMTRQPLDKIGDLQWAQTLNDNDQSVNDAAMLKSLAAEHHITPVNIHNNQLKIEN